MKKALWLSLILGVLQAIAAIIAWQYMPDLLPTNWNAAGEINRYAGRWILFLPAAITIFITILLYFVPKIEPKGKNIERSGKGYPAIMIILAILMSVVLAITIFAGLGYNVPVHLIIPVLVGIMFIIIGNFLPQAKQNYVYGIRLSWTLANEEVWAKTHRLGGKIFVIMGLLWIGGAFLPVPWNFIVPLTGLFIGLFYLGLYAYLEYKKLEKK